MKRLLAILGLMTAFTFPHFATAQDDPAFIEGFGDLPLMDGFTEVAESRLIFDTPAGVIAEVKFQTDMKPFMVAFKYSELMTGLGWADVAISVCEEADCPAQPVRNMTAKRTGTAFLMTFDTSGSSTIVKIELTPIKEPVAGAG